MTAGVRPGSNAGETLVDLRCSVVARHDEFLLVRRQIDGQEDWVLPGGPLRDRESSLACTWWESRDETGLQQLTQVNLRPPIAGHLPALARGSRGTAPRPGNVWRHEPRTAHA
jgi:hypothetical protein